MIRRNRELTFCIWLSLVTIIVMMVVGNIQGNKLKDSNSRLNESLNSCYDKLDDAYFEYYFNKPHNSSVSLRYENIIFEFYTKESYALVSYRDYRDMNITVQTSIMLIEILPSL